MRARSHWCWEKGPTDLFKATGQHNNITMQLLRHFPEQKDVEGFCSQAFTSLMLGEGPKSKLIRLRSIIYNVYNLFTNCTPVPNFEPPYLETSGEHRQGETMQGNKLDNPFLDRTLINQLQQPQPTGKD